MFVFRIVCVICTRSVYWYTYTCTTKTTIFKHASWCADHFVYWMDSVLALSEGSTTTHGVLDIKCIKQGPHCQMFVLRNTLDVRCACFVVGLCHWYTMAVRCLCFKRMLADWARHWHRLSELGNKLHRSIQRICFKLIQPNHSWSWFYGRTANVAESGVFYASHNSWR